MKIVVENEEQKDAIESLLIRVCEKQMWQNVGGDEAREFASEAPIVVSESMD